MSEAPGKVPAALPPALQGMLATYRASEHAPEAAREQIWKTVSAEEPPRRKFPTAPRPRPRARTGWAIGAVTAAAAGALLWWGLSGQRSAALGDRDAGPRDAASMTEREGAASDPVVRPATGARTGARAVDPQVADPPQPDPVDVVSKDGEGPAAPDVVESQRRVAPRRPKAVSPPDASDVGALSTIQAERALIARAWAALTGDDPKVALEIANEHRTRFVAGVLAPEREAVRAIAGCQLDPSGAEATLRAFRAEHHGSPLAARVVKACTP